jgi:hypothetical protein
MPALNLKEVTQYVEANIGDFHKKKLDSLQGLSLITVLTKKNPYLFKVKALLTPADIVKALVDAHLSSNEETVFGNWLEGLAIFINNKVYGGAKSGITGVDLEFTKDGQRYIVAIKSGPKWGNSSQLKKMEDNFATAKKVLRTSGAKVSVEAINGCCYGRENLDKGTYQKYCGQKFWEFISGDANLYTDIIEPLGHNAKNNTDAFNEAYARVLTQFTDNFTKLFCKEDFSIDWIKLTKHNSSSDSADRVKIPRVAKAKAVKAVKVAKKIMEAGEAKVAYARPAKKAVAKKAGPKKVAPKKAVKKAVKKKK